MKKDECIICNKKVKYIEEHRSWALFCSDDCKGKFKKSKLYRNMRF